MRGNTGFIGQQAFAGGAASLTNNGTITADVGGGTITIGVNGAVNNNGTLAAQNGGTLVLNSTINNGVGSQILAGAGSTVLQNGVTPQRHHQRGRRRELPRVQQRWQCPQRGHPDGQPRPGVGGWRRACHGRPWC